MPAGPARRLQPEERAGGPPAVRRENAGGPARFLAAEAEFPAGVHRSVTSSLAHFSLFVRASRSERRGEERLGRMFRTIASAAIVFAFVAFALRHSSLAGPLEEPLLLLFMGTLFLLVGKLSGAPAPKLQPQPELIERRA
jgi:hypothetical protein